MQPRHSDGTLRHPVARAGGPGRRLRGTKRLVRAEGCQGHPRTGHQRFGDGGVCSAGGRRTGPNALLHEDGGALTGPDGREQGQGGGV